MVYARRIDLPQELISVADDNLADHWDEAAKKYPTQVTVSFFLLCRTELPFPFLSFSLSPSFGISLSFFFCCCVRAELLFPLLSFKLFRYIPVTLFFPSYSTHSLLIRLGSRTGVVPCQANREDLRHADTWQVHRLHSTQGISSNFVYCLLGILGAIGTFLQLSFKEMLCWDRYLTNDWLPEIRLGFILNDIWLDTKYKNAGYPVNPKKVCSLTSNYISCTIDRAHISDK